jgi:hypothetical protein
MVKACKPAEKRENAGAQAHRWRRRAKKCKNLLVQGDKRQRIIRMKAEQKCEKRSKVGRFRVFVGLFWRCFDSVSAQRSCCQAGNAPGSLRRGKPDCGRAWPRFIVFHPSPEKSEGWGTRLSIVPYIERSKK